MTLYDLTEEYKAIYELASDTDDIESINELFEKLNGDFGNKLDSCSHIILELKSDSEKIKAEIDRLSKRKKALDNNADAIKERMKYAVVQTGEMKHKTLLHSYSVGNSKSVAIDDLGLLPIEYKRISYDADKKAIKEALELGELQGAHFEYKENLTIR